MWWTPGPMEPKMVVLAVVAVLFWGWVIRQFVVAEAKHATKQQLCQVADGCYDDGPPAAGQ
jgi:hypothetical protein